jgi:hypothetical protein
VKGYRKTKNVNVTLIANRRRAIDRLPQMYSKATPSGQKNVRSNFKLHVCGEDDLHSIFTAYASFSCYRYVIELKMLTINVIQKPKILKYKMSAV